MRSRRLRLEPVIDAEEADATEPLRSRRDIIAWGAIAAVGIAILVNALFLQAGPHPAPIFANKPPATSSERTGSVQLPRPRPAESEPVKSSAPQRLRAEIITDIQRELIRRGFYDGPADGVYGAKTDSAVRDFEHAAGLKPSTEQSETLLRAIMQSSAKARRGAEAAPKVDPIAELIAPPKRVIAVQRVLAAYGYGQINPNGILGPETQAAIQKFERQRKLPVTGQVSDVVVRELAAMTGRPLE